MEFLKRTAVAGLVLTFFTGVGYGMDSFLKDFVKKTTLTIDGGAFSLASMFESGVVAIEGAAGSIVGRLERLVLASGF